MNAFEAPESLQIGCTIVVNLRDSYMKIVTVTEAKEQIDELVNDTNDNHQPILL